MNPSQKKDLLKNINNLLIGLCDEKGVKVIINVKVLAETIEHYLKDLRRIGEHQGDRIAHHTRIGFLVFWLSKLKPICSAIWNKKCC